MPGSGVLRVETIDAHAGGAPVRLVTGGVPALRGRTLDLKRRWVGRHLARVRDALLREPRGHADLIAAVLTEPVSADAVAGVLYFRGDRSPAPCGHALMAVVTAAIERGLLVPPAEAFVIDTLAGPVRVRVDAERQPATGLRVHRVTYRTAPVVVARAAHPVRVEGRALRCDLVWAGGWYAVIDREALGIPPESGSLDRLREGAGRLLEALRPGLVSLEGTETAEHGPAGAVLTGPARAPDADLRSITVSGDGAVDRSPSGEGTAAVLAVLDAMGVMDPGRPLVHEGLAGQSFTATVVDRTRVDGLPAIVAEIGGRAWRTGEHVFLFAPDDPTASGVRS